MKQDVHKNAVPDVIRLWLLLLAALGCLGFGLSNSWHWLTVLGGLIFVIYAYLNGRPARRRLFADRVNPSNPATGAALVPGTFSDGAGRYTGSDK